MALKETEYKIIIKGKGFKPNPIAEKGIPKFADSRNYQNVIGTVAWEKWWEEQFNYCVNGYETGGMFIPGRYYYYLNFCYISTVGRGNHYPDFVDADYEFFTAVEEAKKEHKGIMLLKARRRGASEKLKAIINHGLRFTCEEYHAGIVAGLQTYSDALFAKVKSHNSHVAPELFVQHLKSDSEEYILGYEEKTKQGLIKKGSANKVICKTMGKNPNVLKGHFFDDVAFEESGENEVLEAGYGATKDCFMDGDVMKGTPYIFGCVCAGTKVWDAKGNLVNIEDLKQEDGILGHSDTEVSVEPITHFNPPLEKPCYRIETTKGSVLECSNDHPILYSKKGLSSGKKENRKKVAKFLDAKDLQPGNQIAITDAVPIYGEKELWEPRFIGWLIGDGSYGFDKTPVLSNCESEINEYVLNKFDCTVEKEYLTKEGKKYQEIRVRSICPTLRSIGIYGQTKTNKRLPNEVHSLKKEDICELVGGLFDTDGHVNNSTKENKSIVLTSAALEFLREVKLLLLKLGIHCNISEIKPYQYGRKIQSKEPYYRINISDVVSMIRFYDQIKFIVKYKQEKLNQVFSLIKGTIPRISYKGGVTGIRFERVKSVEFIGIKPIYNLTAGKTHTYLANGIVTHNTGGDINAASKGFQKMWFDESLDKQFIKIRMHAQRLYRGCYMGYKRNNKLEEDCPNILHNPEYKGKGYTREQFLGCEDVPRALEKIMTVRAELEKGVDRKPYFDNLQNNPTNDNEAFLKFSGNPYDSKKLSLNRTHIASNALAYKPFILTWKKNSNGTLCDPLEIDEVRKPENETELRNAIYIAYFPKRGIKNLYVAGIDSYDIDQTMTSKSLGAMCVLSRDIGTIPFEEIMAPACIIRQRPERKEIFWENCLKVAVYYNLICNAESGNVLIDYAKPGIIDFFKKHGGEKFLAIRPKSIESANSEQINVYGCNMVPRAKNSMISYTQSWVDDHVSKNVFEVLAQELSDYDVDTKDSDNDLADALGLALIRHHDMVYLPTTISEEVEYDVPEHIYESNDMGSLIAVNVSNLKKMKLTTANGTIINDELTLLLNAGLVGNQYDDYDQYNQEE